MPGGTAGKQQVRRTKIHRHGWLAIDKPSGLTSTQVVGRVRYLTHAFKAGHGGTLDPLAPGVLPIALGEATKTVSFVMEGLKSYQFTIRWGERRDTDDSDGRVVACSERRPTTEEIQGVLPSFTGEIMQKPPSYSAVKVAGRRAYEIARSDQVVELEPRRVLIARFELMQVLDDDHSLFELECGKGGYVRAVVRDLALKLGTEGHVSALRRTRVGPFTLERAISLAQLEALNDSAALEERLLPLIEGLAGVPNLRIDAAQAARLQNGQAVPLVRAPRHDDGDRIEAPAVMCAVFAERPVALVDFRAGEIRPKRVFNFSA